MCDVTVTCVANIRCVCVSRRPPETLCPRAPGAGALTAPAVARVSGAAVRAASLCPSYCGMGPTAGAASLSAQVPCLDCGTLTRLRRDQPRSVRGSRCPLPCRSATERRCFRHLLPLLLISSCSLFLQVAFFCQIQCQMSAPSHSPLSPTGENSN